MCFVLKAREIMDGEGQELPTTKKKKKNHTPIHKYALDKAC
jgi:hypothetical protein